MDMSGLVWIEVQSCPIDIKPITEHIWSSKCSFFMYCIIVRVSQYCRTLMIMSVSSPSFPSDVPLAICMAHVMICSMSISSLCSLERYSYRDPPLAYSVKHTHTHTHLKKDKMWTAPKNHPCKRQSATYNLSHWKPSVWVWSSINGY